MSRDVNTANKRRYDSVTDYDRKLLKTEIVHIGFGAFHRGHQAVYNDLTNQVSGRPWGICEINLFGSEQLVEDLLAQDCLFSVYENSAHGSCSRLVRTVTEAIHTPLHGIDKAIEKLAEPQVKLISLTITEKGYCVDPNSGELDLNNALVRHDLATPQQPQSAIGLIVEALRLRKQRGLAPVSVMSCDNIPENGHLTKNALIGFAKTVDGELARWIEDNVSFPSTMVDRIVPAMTEDAFAALEQHTGYADPCGVVCEEFRQWVIEDNFVAGRPDWNLAGAMFVTDVLPYEEMKLRMLNGSHSFLAYNGSLAGFEYIYQCMENNDFRQATFKLMLEEQAKSLSPNLDVDLAAYAKVLIERFSNPNIKHKTAQIAMDGSQKLTQRAIDPLQQLLAKGLSPKCLPVSIAGWMHFVIASFAKGQAVEDPMAEQFRQVLADVETPELKVRSMLSLSPIFGELPHTHPQFADAVVSAFIQIQQLGIQAVIRQLLAE